MVNQSQLLKQQFKILPQQIQMLGIFHLNMLDLEQRIKDELDENPLLETVMADEEMLPIADPDAPPQEFQNFDEYVYDDIPNYSVENQGYLHNESLDIPIREAFDFRSMLKQQLINLNLKEVEKDISSFIVDCISENGFLERTVAELADDFSFCYKTFVTEDVVEDVVKKVKELDPIGIASQDIREFLIKQLQHQKPDKIVKKCIELLTTCYPDLRSQHFKKICSALKVDEEELSILIKHIAKLQLKPVNITREDEPLKDTIIPDFILSVEDEVITVELYKQKSHTLFINDTLARNIEEKHVKTAEEKSKAQYLKSKLSSAQWFIDAIRQREENMLKIMRVIAEKQKKYFCSGEKADLEPMALRNIAEKTGLDISTVSRITCNKYTDTPFGLVWLRDLFSAGLENEEGLFVSNKVIQISLKEIIEREDPRNPYNDQQLVKILAQKGIKIARRTISKYREQLSIPIGNMRKLWNNNEYSH